MQPTWRQFFLCDLIRTGGCEAGVGKDMMGAVGYNKGVEHGFTWSASISSVSENGLRMLIYRLGGCRRDRRGTVETSTYEI
jgi:hypothetical protein